MYFDSAGETGVANAGEGESDRNGFGDLEPAPSVNSDGWVLEDLGDACGFGL